ncbi:hypothetical protein [Nostoc sp.]|uniref:hypothetical protein n=1 Tax=Nostoc sp. TaxID=1180 RepID=UPI002FF980CA
MTLSQGLWLHRAAIPLKKSALIWFVCMGELVFKGIGGQCPTPVTILGKPQTLADSLTLRYRF